MARFPRLILQFAAATGIAAMLSTTAPVMAADQAVTSRETAAKIMPSTIKRHALRARLAASDYHRHVNPIASDLGCSGIWCGRQFVLMIGVGY
jgi:hypothetical protein